MIAAVVPEIAATDRSISPSSSTKTSPRATKPITVICSERLDRLRADRNTPLSSRT